MARQAPPGVGKLKQDFIDNIQNQNNMPQLNQKIPLEWNMSRHIDRMSVYCVNKNSLIDAVKFMEATLRHFWESDTKARKKMIMRHEVMNKELQQCKLPGGKINQNQYLTVMHRHHLLIYGDLIALLYKRNMIERAPITDVII